MSVMILECSWYHHRYPDKLSPAGCGHRLLAICETTVVVSGLVYTGPQMRHYQHVVWDPIGLEAFASMFLLMMITITL